MDKIKNKNFFVNTSFANCFSSHQYFTTNSYKLNTLQVLFLSLITVHKKRNKSFKLLNWLPFYYLASFFKFSKVFIFFIQKRVNIEIWLFCFLASY